MAYVRRVCLDHHVEAVPLNWDDEGRQQLDLVIALGGDGTVLHALGMYPHTPVLAINFGTVGFLTAGNKEHYETILERLLKGNYCMSERIMLECQFKGQRFQVVNELVIKAATRMVSVDCIINEIPVRHIRGDGVIIGTPTGSTAYLLSAGSPIVMPEIQCMILTGLNEYNFTARPLVVTHDAKIRLQITPQTSDTHLQLNIDGAQKGKVEIGDEFIIQRSEQMARLLFMDKSYFFSNLTSRLSW